MEEIGTVTSWASPICIEVLLVGYMWASPICIEVLLVGYMHLWFALVDF